MTIKGILARFAALYTGLVAALAGTRYFLDIDGGIAVDIVILGLSIYAVCWAFGRENGRYFEGTEKAKIVVGFIAISVSVQGGFLWLAVSQSSGQISGAAALFSLGLVGVVHSVLIYLFVGLAKRPLLKQGVITA